MLMLQGKLVNNCYFKIFVLLFIIFVLLDYHSLFIELLVTKKTENIHNGTLIHLMVKNTLKII